MTWAFYVGDHVYIDDDGLTHVVAVANASMGRWGTKCRRWNDIEFRYSFKRGQVMRTTGPATCLWCTTEPSRR